LKSLGKPASAGNTPPSSNQEMRILGVDTALRTTGFGVIDTDGRRFQAIDCGVIKTTPKQPLSECLRRLTGGIREIVKEYAPDVAVIEGAFYFQNARTALVLGAARGAVIATLAELAIPMYEYSPRKMKQAVCGHGNASKDQVALLVSQSLGITVGKLPDDATDALGLAICHAQICVTANGLLKPDPL